MGDNANVVWRPIPTLPPGAIPEGLSVPNDIPDPKGVSRTEPKKSDSADPNDVRVVRAGGFPYVAYTAQTEGTEPILVSPKAGGKEGPGQKLWMPTNAVPEYRARAQGAQEVRIESTQSKNPDVAVNADKKGRDGSAFLARLARR